MKKFFSAALACALLIGCLFTLVSCGKTISGKYEADWALVEVTYDFKSSGKVTVGIEPFIGDSFSFDGSYTFNEEGDQITITLDSDNEEAEKYSGTLSYSEGEEDGEKYIKLSGLKYKLVD